MMLGEESESADYWKKCGDEALSHNIKGIIIMVGYNLALNIDEISLTLSGSPLGLQRRPDRASHQPQSRQKSSRLCPSRQIRKLQTQS